MSNTFITAQQIARQALPLLRSNLVFPMLTYNDYSDEFANFGDTIQVRKPPVYEAKEFNGAIEPQDIVEDRVLVKMDKIADVSVEITAKEMALNLESFTTQVIEPAAVAIAEKINRDGLQLYRDVPSMIGYPGYLPDSLDPLAEARKTLNENNAPLFPRYGVWDPNADMALSTVPAIVNADKRGSTEALTEGAIGRIQGLDNYMSQHVAEHVCGVGGSSFCCYNTVLAGSTSFALKGTGVSGQLKKGDVLEIDDVYYTVTADTGNASNNVFTNVEVWPALPELGSNTAVTLVDKYTANLVFHKNAFAFVTRPLEIAHGVESYVTNFEGITLRVTFGYDVAAKKQILSIDTLYGFKTLYPELAVKVVG